MTSDEVRVRLTAIRENLPAQFSQSAARRLMLSYENYKHILQVLGQRYPSISAGVWAALPEIEMGIREAIKGTPKKAAEECFGKAKGEITEGINGILAADAGKGG
jgi:hypothetical protein